MAKIQGFCALSIIIFLSITSIMYAEVGVGVGLSPWGVSAKEKKQEKKADTFIQEMATYFNMPLIELEKLWIRGYGRNELIKLILISKQSGQELAAIIKQRDKNVRLSRLSEKYNLDYSEILSQAERIRQELDNKVLVSTHSTYGVQTSSPGIIVYSSQHFEVNRSSDAASEK